MSGLPSLCEELARWIARSPPGSPPDWPAETWELFRQAAQVHGAAPLLWRQACGLPAWAASPIGRWLDDQYAWNARRVARLHGELAEILHLFAAEGVPLLPVKGAVLGALYYEDAAARPMADLDVLLRAEHFTAGEALLARLGYARIFTGWKHSRFARPAPGGTGAVADPTREHPDNPRQLEVHPRCRERIADAVVDLTDCLWGSARQGTLLGAPAWLPAPDAAWLHLLIHATHHVLLNNFRLIQLADLALLMPAVNDPEALLLAVDARATYPALALLDRYFQRGAELLAALRARLSAGYAAWADGLDLFAVCHLNPVPWRDG
jgi:hypothetical protein